MSKMKKIEIIRLVESSVLSKTATLDKYDIPQSTYYRWKGNLKKYGVQGLVDNKPHRLRQWNQIKPEEDQMIVEVALLNPEWSSREVALYITDNRGFSVSESTVYRRLKAQGLIKEFISKTFPASNDYMPLPEIMLFTIAKHLGWSKETLERYYVLILNAEQLSDEDFMKKYDSDSKTFTIRIIPDAVKFTTGMREMVDIIKDILRKA